MEVSGQHQASAALLPKKGPPAPLNRELGGSQSCSGRFEEEKNFLTQPEFEFRFVKPAA